MSRKSHEDRMVRKSANRIRRTTPSELARLARRMDDPVDTSDMPQRTGPCNRVVRDADGKIVKPQDSLLRSAVLAEMKRRRLSGHKLWKASRNYCETLPESAVYEFLAGKRQIGLAYLDAILEAMDLTIAPK